MSVTFYNWSGEDIDVRWDGKPYPVRKGELVTDFVRSASGEGLVLQRGIVETFAKQLGDRECNRLNVNPQHVDKWQEIIDRALKGPAEYHDAKLEPEARPEHLKFIDEAEKAEKKASKKASKKADDIVSEPAAE